ncbi:hypothetical protein AGOR_G00249160 [Albula goreensis]|uniref:Tetraspanin n=1 Tax=Albula goreensis TaxID=1534307 RepID=A0A8T3CEM2_9TELE|nr:hypothetical protein AGOR_G00249160 [Albula goreensis]
MRLEDKIGILKFLLMVFNGVFMIIGLAIFGCGIWILFDKSSFVVTISGGDMKIVAGGLFVIGLVVVGVSGLGYISASKEIQFLMLLYMALLIVIVLGQLFVTFVLLLQKDKVMEALIVEMDEIIMEYGTDWKNSSTGLWDILDGVQHYSKCCGRTNYTQWENNIVINGRENVYPCSCFNSSCPFLSDDMMRFGKGTDIHKEGCERKIKNWLEVNGLAILGMDAGLVFVQIIQFIISFYLHRNIKRKVKQRRLLHNSEDIAASDSPYQHLD